MGRLGYYSKLSFQAPEEVIPKKNFAESGRHCVTPARAAAKHIFTGDEMLFGFSRKIV